MTYSNDYTRRAWAKESDMPATKTTIAIRADGWGRYTRSELMAAVRAKGSVGIGISAGPGVAGGYVPCAKKAALVFLRGQSPSAMLSAYIARDEHTRERTVFKGYNNDTGYRDYETITETVVSYRVIIGGNQF